MLDTVARVRAALLAQGFVPIAVATGDKNPVNNGWNMREDGDAHLPVALGAQNTGVGCKGLRAVDIDVDDPARAGQLRELALAKLGAAPIRWRENSSRCLLLYRAVEGAPKKRWIVSKTFKSADGKFEKVEVLGAGQQFVAYGKHPSGAELSWTPKGPLEVSRDALTAVTEEQIDAYLAEAAKIIDAPPPAKAHPPAPAGGNGDGQVLTPMPAPPSVIKQKLTPDQIEHARNIVDRSLDKIASAPPGTSNDTINREARTLAGLVAAGLPDEGLRERAWEAAMERAAKGGNDPRETRRTLESGWRSGAHSPLVTDCKWPAETLEQASADCARAMAKQGVKSAQPTLNGVQHALGQSKIVLTYSEFIAEYEPLEYVLDGIVARGSLYTLTAKTGAGKTVLLSAASIAVASNDHVMLGVGVKQCAIAYLTYENPADFRMKLHAAAVANGKTGADLDQGLFVIRAHLVLADAYKELVATGVEFGLIVIDTLQAAFDGNDFNDPKQMLDFILRCRRFTELPGHPAVIVAAHPTKNADNDNLVPYGGGSVLNEIDGNLTLSLVKETKITTLHWLRKFRGPEFQPISFGIMSTRCPQMADANGKILTLPTVKLVGDDYVATKDDETEKREMTLLQTLLNNPGMTLANLADSAGYGSHSAAQKALERMAGDKLVEKINKKFSVTNRGKKALTIYYGGSLEPFTPA